MFRCTYFDPYSLKDLTKYLSFLLYLSIFSWLEVTYVSPEIAPVSFLPSRKNFKISTTDPKIPDIMPLYEFVEGSWISEKMLPGEWKKSSQCNPYSGRCSCLQEWSIYLKECTENNTHIPVILEASGWMTDWPYLSGLHRCKHSMCDVRHGHTKDSRTHARLFSVTDASVEKANANGAIMVFVAMESRTRIPLHGALEFKYFFDLGVSYHNQFDVQVSYNNYLPKDFSSTGAPFEKKRNSLLFMHSNCGPSHRNELFDSISKLISIDALGFCKKNGDVATTLPQCAGLPRSGGTVWSENECLLHHYKFYLAIENSRDEDYVTEKLYQGLRSGSVPIYLGAPNIRDVLPHPDSALLIEDFVNIDALIDYVKLAISDEQLYAKHMAWKSFPLSSKFMNRIVTNPLDSIFCRTCDVIATKYGDGIGPVVGGKGDSLSLPWCIIRSLNSNADAVIKSWHRNDAFLLSDFNSQTYVLSVKDAIDRQEFMKSQLSMTRLNADLILGYESSELDASMISCWYRRSAFSSFTSHAIGPKVLSITMTHFLAFWDIWQKGTDVALILEDDAELVPTFNQDVAAALLESPPNWDMISVGTCCDILPAGESQRVTQHLFLPNSLDAPTRCSHAILWSYRGVQKALRSLPIRSAIDWHINLVAAEGDWESYVIEPPLSSQSKKFLSLLQPERNDLSLRSTFM